MVDQPSPQSLGEIIRRQRELAELPMRQFASFVGISIPYLSQIERNLRQPSDHVLEAIASNLQMSADALRAQASSDESDGGSPVLRAIGQDPDLTKSQRLALREMYETFRAVTLANRRRPRSADAPDDED